MYSTFRTATRNWLSPPARRFSIFSFITVSGFVFPIAYFPLYFDTLGLTPFKIALLSTAGTIATIVGAPAATQIAYSKISARKLFRALGALSCVLACALPFLHAFPLLLLALFACLFCKYGADFLVDSEQVRRNSRGELRYEHVRVWGSVGYAALGAVCGVVVERAGVAWTPLLFCLLITLLFLFGGSITPLLKEHPDAKLTAGLPPESHADSKQSNAILLSFICLACLLWASHGPMYAFLSLYLQSLGWGGNGISFAWNIGVVTEILLFFLFPTIQQRFSLPVIFRFSAGMTVVRWLLLAVSQQPAAILISQALHAFSFAGCFMSSVKMVHLALPERRKDRGYSLFISLGPGVGSIIGRIGAGACATHLPSYRDLGPVFLAAAGLAFAAFALSFKLPLRATEPPLTGAEHGPLSA